MFLNLICSPIFYRVLFDVLYLWQQLWRKVRIGWKVAKRMQRAWNAWKNSLKAANGNLSLIRWKVTTFWRDVPRQCAPIQSITCIRSITAIKVEQELRKTVYGRYSCLKSFDCTKTCHCDNVKTRLLFTFSGT